MPQVKVKSPQGEVYTVTAPDGATDEQIIAYARSQFEKPEVKAAPLPSKKKDEVGGFGNALLYGFGEPVRNVGKTAEVLGAEDLGRLLQSVPSPEGYVSAAQKFSEPNPDDFQIAGFAPAYLPRAAFEQAGQLAGSLVSRAAGAGLGAMVAGPVGAVVGGIAAPTLFGAAQVVGDIAKDRAKRNGREKPNGEDIAFALAAGAASGGVDALSAKFISDAAGPVLKRLGVGALSEGSTEFAQSIVEQAGASLGTKTGVEISPRQAIAEGIIGGVSGAPAAGLLGASGPQKVEEDEQEREVLPNEPIEAPEGAPAIGTVASIQEEGDEGAPGVIRNLTISGYLRTPEGDTVVSYIDPDNPTAGRADLLLSELNDLKVDTPAGVEPVTAAPVAPDVGDEGQTAPPEPVPVGGPPVPPPIEGVDADQTLTAEERAARASAETGGVYDPAVKPLKATAVLSRLPTPELQLEFKTLNTQIKKLETLIPQVSDSPKLFAAKKAEYEQVASRLEELSKLAADPRQTGEPLVTPSPGIGGSLEGSVPFGQSAAERPLNLGPIAKPKAPNLLGALGENAEKPGFEPAPSGTSGDDPRITAYNKSLPRRQQADEANRLNMVAKVAQDYSKTSGIKPQSLFTYIRSKGGIDPLSDGASLLTDAPKNLFSRKGGTGVKFNELATLANDYLTDSTDSTQGAEGEIGRGGTAQNTDALVKALSTNGGKDVYASNDRNTAESANEKQRIKSQYGPGVLGVYRKVLQETYEVSTDGSIKVNEAKNLLLQKMEEQDSTKEAADRQALVERIAAEKAQQQASVEQQAQVGQPTDEQIAADEAAAILADRGAPEAAPIANQNVDENGEDLTLTKVRSPDDVRGVGEPVGDELTGAEFNKMIESLKRIFPNSQIALRFEAKLEELINGKLTAIDGKYLKRVITLALDTKNKLEALDHEIIHALRDLDVFTDAEWNALKKSALSNEALMADVRKAYPEYKGERLAEEAVAELHKGWVSGKISLRPIGTLKSGLQAIRNFFSRFGQWLGFNGFSTPQGIFEAVAAGRIGGREVGQTGRRKAAEFAVRPTTDKVTVYDENDQPVLADQYVVPGAEQAPDKAKSAANQKMLDMARLKGQQTKMRSSKPQKEAGGLFGDEGGDQGTLFAKRQQEKVERNEQGMPVQELEATKERVAEINAKAKELLENTAANPNQEISFIGRYAGFASAVAAVNRTFAKYHRIVRDKLAFEHSMVEDGNKLLLKALNLTKAGRQKLDAILEHDRLERIDRNMNSKRSIVVTMPTNYKGVNAKPGETIVLNAAEKAALKDIRTLMADRWKSYGAAIAEQFGYTGEWTPAAIDKALNEAALSGDRGAVAKLNNVKELAEQTKSLAGYAPFMRYGDYGFTVKQKANSESPKNNLGGFAKTVHFEMIDTKNLLSDIRGSSKQRDQLVAKKMAELRKKFPADQYEIKANRVQKEDIETLDIPMIEKMFAALNIKQDAKRQEFLDGMIKQMRAAQRIDFTRKSSNMPGYSPRIINSLIDYNTASAGAISGIKFNTAKKEAFDATQNRAQGSTQEVQQNVAAFAKDFNEYIDSSDALAGRIKQYGFWTSLWASPASALVNLSQTPMITATQIAAWANFGSYARTNILSLSLLKKMRVGKDGVRLDFDKMNFASKAEKDAFMLAVRDGTINPQTTQDLLGDDGRPDFGQSGKKSGVFETFRKAFDIGSSMFTTAEQVNRATAWLSAYREVQKPGALAKFKKMYAQDQRIQSMDLTKENIAKFITDETQFIGGRSDRPFVLRGAGGVAFQFKTYPMNYMKILYQNFTRQGPAGKLAGMMMMTALIAASGLLGLPFAEDMVNLVDWGITQTTGIDPMIETKVRNFVNEMSGSPEFAEIVSRGALRNTGVNLGSRLGQGELVPDANILASIPVFGTTYQRFIEAEKRFSSNQPVGGATALLSPIIGKGPADLFRAVALGEEGQRTIQRGDIKVPYSEVTGAEQLTKAIGFQPSKYARIQEEDRVNQRIKYKTRLAEQRLQGNLASLLANSLSARKAGDIEKADKFMKELADTYKEAARDLGNPNIPLEDKVKIPSLESTKNRAISMTNPEINLKRADRMKQRFMRETDESYTGD